MRRKMSSFYGLIELVLVFGALTWFVWSQKRALRKSREEDAEAEKQSVDTSQDDPSAPR